MQTKSKLKLQYCFEKGEDLPPAVRRIISEQLTRAVEVLSRAEDSLQDAVHEARRCIKRARSVLRLVKFAIPNAYAQENRRLRVIGRSLSELRDSHALIQTLDKLEEHRNKKEQPNGSRHLAYANAHEFLARREQQITKSMEEGGMENSIAQLQEALIHLAKLSYANVDRDGISKSLYKSVKRGMKAFAAAEADGEAENFHEWRKRAKDLRYQLSLLAELRPDLQKHSESAKELEQLLGDDHNLAVLTDLLSEAHISNGGRFQYLQKQISGRQSDLRDQAVKLGKHLYRQKKIWKHRLAPSETNL